MEVDKMRAAFLMATLFLFCQIKAQEGTEAANIAKKLANPIASLTSVPFQNNLDVGIDSSNGWRNTLNFQPVIPIHLSGSLNLIIRWVQPVIVQQNLIDGEVSRQAGLADAVVSAFFSPSKSGAGFTWGSGPAFLVPDATDEKLGSKKFGVGPTIVALKQKAGWTIGMLMNQIWSVAGNKDRPDVNQMYVQPFVGFNWKSGAGMVVNSETTLNWQSNSTTAFLNFMFTAITKFGKQMASIQLGPRIQLSAPQNAKADFGIRAAVILVFPKK